MHQFALQERQVLNDLAGWMMDRRARPVPVRPARAAALPALTPSGIGMRDTWSALRDVLLPTAFPTDHPRYLAFVGGAPTPASMIADAALSAAAVYGGSEIEAGDVVAAESEVIRWLCGLVGFSTGSHGAFVSGGSMANLSALVAARHGWYARDGRSASIIVAGAAAHASVRSAAAIMGCEVVLAGSPDRPMTGDDVEAATAGLDPNDVVAVVATAGATNTGAVDELHEVADSCALHGVWMHVDAAYGGAALLSPSHRGVFAGIYRADSVTIDPHKWLFTPFDCATVIYRDGAIAREAHRQRAPYLETVNAPEADNPADYAVHLSRRARGLPVWASLVANGTDAYADAVETCLMAATYAAKRVESTRYLEMVCEPHLSVVLFRRIGWTRKDYVRWSDEARDTGVALVVPTTFEGEPVFRLCFVNPLTTAEDVDLILDSMEQPSWS